MRDYKAPVAATRERCRSSPSHHRRHGSECTRFTVITDTERDEKMLIAGLGALPLRDRGLRTHLHRAAAHHCRHRRG